MGKKIHPKKYYPSSKRAVKSSVGKGNSKSTQKLYRKLGKVGNITPYAKKYKGKKTHKKYAEMISFKNTTQARISARKLRKEFREAKRKDKKIRIVRATQDASNRAKAITKRKNLNVDERKQFKEIGKIYDTVAKSMKEKYEK